MKPANRSHAVLRVDRDAALGCAAASGRDGAEPASDGSAADAPRSPRRSGDRARVRQLLRRDVDGRTALTATTYRISWTSDPRLGAGRSRIVRRLLQAGPWSCAPQGSCIARKTRPAADANSAMTSDQISYDAHAESGAVVGWRREPSGRGRIRSRPGRAARRRTRRRPPRDARAHRPRLPTGAGGTDPFAAQRRVPGRAESGDRTGRCWRGRTPRSTKPRPPCDWCVPTSTRSVGRSAVRRRAPADEAVAALHALLAARGAVRGRPPRRRPLRASSTISRRRRRTTR